jgi:hypothetical protein
MRQRGFSTTATVVAAALAAVVIAPLLMNWLVVDIDTSGKDAVHLKLPVPLALVRVALAVAPSRELTTSLPHQVTDRRAEALSALRALAQSPDAAFVSVTTPDTRVRVSKENGLLLVDVDAPDANVRCRVPLAAVQQTLERWDWQHAHPRLLLDLLAQTGPGELVAVRTPDARVRIAKW